MKLKNKIHLWSTLLMLVILLLLAIVIYFAFSRLAYDTEISQLQAELDAVAQAVSDNPADDPRAGRWAGLAKTECGIHL